jgi:3-oxoacyl-[acyl-carrier protein] reductase/7-alpha-hydroxysteroid dehydrogenase
MLQGKVAVVTGGTRGIGLAIVKKFLHNGAKVALLGSRQETVDKALATLKAENADYQVIGFCPNLKDPKAVGETFAKVKETFGSLDILANNAGVSARESLYTYTLEDFQKTIDLNITSLFVCSQAAARIMKEQGGGVIINTSSMVGTYGQPSGVAYPASKAAVNNLTKSLARELGKDNIRVNAVAPGITRTDMMAAVPEAMLKPLVARVPLGRIGEPEDVAACFAFLASEYASYITGAVIPVDGGAMV